MQWLTTKRLRKIQYVLICALAVSASALIIVSVVAMNNSCN